MQKFIMNYTDIFSQQTFSCSKSAIETVGRKWCELPSKLTIKTLEQRQF